MVNHMRASTASGGTPRPWSYIAPRLLCAVASPCAAARRYHATAAAASCGTPAPVTYMPPRMRCASASPASALARRSARACAAGLCASCVGTQAVRVVTTRAVHSTWRLMASPPQALADGSSTRRRGDGAIAGGAGERRSAPVTVWPCRSGRFRPTALSPMGRRAGSVAASTAPGRPKGRLQPWRAQRYRQRADGPPSRVSPSGGRRCRSSDGEPSAFETRASPISPCVVPRV